MKKFFTYYEHILSSLKNPAILFTLFAVLTIGATALYSAPPATKYMPGETLDPNCGPGDLNCSVEIGSSLWEQDGLDIYYNTGNVGLGASAYLNWGSPFGSGGYGLRDSAGTLEFKDSAGSWTAFNSLGGGGGGSLWSLHANGEDIYYNDGFVGVNTNEPEYQFESTSNTVAGRFRGEVVEAEEPEPWDLTVYTQDGYYEVLPPFGEACESYGSTFSPAGTKMFLSGHCFPSGPFLPFSIHEYDLSTPWDVNTAVDTGNSYDPVLEGDALYPPRGSAFTPDGQTMFVINSTYDDDGWLGGGEIHEYSLTTPWSLASGNVTYVDTKVFFDLDAIGAFAFSGDGMDLFVGAIYYDGDKDEEVQILQYELPAAYDISNVNGLPTKTAQLYYDGGWNIPNGAASFDVTGDNLFASWYDGVDATIRKYPLSTSWDIDTLDPTVFDVYDAPVLLVNNIVTSPRDPISLTFRPDGLAFYVTDHDGPGVAQYSLGAGEPDIIGGDVIVDGKLAVGNTNPSHKLHVTSSGSGIVAMFNDVNASCWVDPSGWGFDCSSDERLKSEIFSINSNTTIESSLSRLSQLNPVSYRWNNEEGTGAPMRYGLIAQEVQEVFPELVSTGPLLDSNNPAAGNSLGVSYAGFTPFIIDAISELNDRVDFISSLSLDSSESSIEIGGSLPEIIVRVLKDVVLHVKELVASTIHTSKLCIDDVCFTADEAQKVKELIEKERQGHEDKREAEHMPEIKPAEKITDPELETENDFLINEE